MRRHETAPRTTRASRARTGWWSTAAPPAALGGGSTVGRNALLGLPGWQPWKVPHTESVWAGAHWACRLPIFVAFVALLAAVAVWPSAKNLSHLSALSAAVLIGVQFWHADRGGMYVL